MSTLKLVYFHFRARAECIRLLLVAAKREFEDVRIPRDEWSPELKEEAPFGKVPYIIFENGKKYAQSLAIASYFAREHDMYGKDNLENLRVDQVVQLVNDLLLSLREWIMEKDPTKKAEVAERLKEDTFPRFLMWLEELLLENGTVGFFVGDKLTLADIACYDILDTLLGFDNKVLAPYPNLKKLRSNVEAIPSIREYLAKRPHTSY